MKANKILLLLMLLFCSLSFSQVGIGTISPSSSAILDLTASNKALLLTRVASTAAITAPINGMMIYDISSNCFKAYSNGAWTECLLGVTTVSIATLDCTRATNNGTLTQAIAASGVSSVISYIGGNGLSHTGQIVASTGVTGLTATLSAGTFAIGAGTLTYNITGTPVGSGTASFALNIGGQSCNLTRSVAAIATTYPTGTGTFSGKTCFDIALGNDNTNSCGPLTARTPTKSDFTLTATNTQTYIFRPIGTVSNVRFVYINSNGTPITAISGNNTGNNINTPVNATVTYSSGLNTAASGLTNSNALKADIYVIYNDGATGGGTDRQLKLTASIKDCACCGAYISPTVWKEFLCHNLGADTSLDPHVPVVGLQGAYIQWGKRGPNTTGDSRVDWVTAANNGALGFAAAPTAGNANQGLLSGWSTTSAADNSWRTAGGAKTANDPCPSGYRVPTNAEWIGVDANNTVSRSGAWTNSATNYNTALHFGPNASTKLLTLPAAGYRETTNGSLPSRGLSGLYWSSTETADLLFFNGGGLNPSGNFDRTYGFSVRCIAE